MGWESRKRAPSASQEPLTWMVERTPQAMLTATSPVNAGVELSLTTTVAFPAAVVPSATNVEPLNVTPPGRSAAV